MVTFSDLMCLLLSFFVLLLSFSSVNQQDFDHALTSIQGALGAPGRPGGRQSSSPLSDAGDGQPAEDAARELQRRFQVVGLAQKVTIALDAEDGLSILLPDSILFDAGSADLKPDAFTVLRDIVDVLKRFSNMSVDVRGHTDSSSLNTSSAYRDNYDLSYQRAHAVMSELAGPGRLPAQQFEITAAGATQPSAPNTSDEGRSANRRVDIHVRGLTDQDMAETPTGGQAGTARTDAAPVGESMTVDMQ